MPYVPTSVVETFQRLKKESPFYITLKVIRGKYFYVYKEKGEWDKINKRQRIISNYLGKITKDGIFVKKSEHVQNELEKAEALIVAHGGTVEMPNKNQAIIRSSEAEKMMPDEVDKALLTILSMNAKADLSYWGKQLKLKGSTVYSRVKQLEQKYRIRYFAELDVGKLGYLNYMALIKFGDKKPPTDQLKTILENEPRVQFSIATVGAYDLVVHFLAENNDVAADFVYGLRNHEFLREYPSTWYISPLYVSYGCFPIREKFFELIKEKIWTRTKDTPLRMQGQLTQKQYHVLAELSKNGVEEFSEIDKKYAFKGEGAGYTYHRLKDDGIIKRITITMNKLPVKYLALIMMSKINSKKVAESRRELLTNILEKTRMGTDKYTLVSDSGIPDGGLFIRGVYDGENLSEIEESLRKNVAGTIINSLVVTNLLSGDICYRMFDKMYSSQYKILVRDYGAKEMQSNNYDKTEQTLDKSINIKN